MIAYHASPELFDRFICTEQGVHLGSLQSAREAIHRKIGNGKYYLYKVKIDTRQFIEEFDQGYDWKKSFEKEPSNIKGYVYKNKYEPSTRHSFVTWVPEKTLEILSVEERYL